LVFPAWLAVTLQVPAPVMIRMPVGLLVALVSAGAAHSPAAAAVLIYRLVSCWAIVPVGPAL
jgi:hypothetical protein